MRKLTAVVVCAGLGMSILGACGGGSSNGASSDTTNPNAGLAGNGADTTTTGPFSGGGAAQMGPPTGKVRIANTLTVNGQPGPAMDFYDVDRPTAADTPIIKDLKYGEISDYVSPRAPVAGDPSNLYIYPAGSLTKTEVLTGSGISQSGFADGDQRTIAITPSDLNFGLTQIIEAGPDLPPAADISVPSGQGALLVEGTIHGDPTTAPELFLMVDGSCPTGRGFQIPPSISVGDIPTVFPLAPGSHTLGVYTTPAGAGIHDCNGKTASGPTTTVDVNAGEKIDVFVYGDATAPSILTAPVAG